MRYLMDGKEVEITPVTVEDRKHLALKMNKELSHKVVSDTGVSYITSEALKKCKPIKELNSKDKEG